MRATKFEFIIGSSGFEKKEVKDYSLGMRQKLGIALAIMESPDLLILDEPFNGLDTYSIGSIREILKSLKYEGATIIIATHIKEDIDILCDETYLVKDCNVTQL